MILCNNFFSFVLLSSGDMAMADKLVKAKANLNLENSNGDTPLIVAKASGLLDI